MVTGKNPWSAIGTVIQLANGSAYPPLEEEELARSGVEFANLATVRGVLALIGGMQLPAGADVEPKYRGVVERALADEYSTERTQLIADLAAIVGGTDTAEIAKRSVAAASRMVLVPHYELDDGQLRVTHRYLAESLSARLAYITLLLLDQSRPYRGRLCRCRLETCGNFFWERRSVEGGQPGRAYCRHEHMQEAQKALMLERVRKYRKNKAAKRQVRKPK